MPTFHRVRVDLQGKALAELAALGIETDHGDFQPGRSFTTDLSESELNSVRAAGWKTQVLIEDVAAYYAQPRPSQAAAERRSACAPKNSLLFPRPQHYTDGSMGGYPTYAEMLEVLDDMRAAYPNLVSSLGFVSDTIVTHQSRPLYYLRISDNPDVVEANEPQVLYTALHHAREPNSMSQLLYFMWHLLESYGQDPEITYLLNEGALYFIPCVNPDGYLFNEFNYPNGGGLWRKNLRDNGDGTFGVDLNRNYGFEWGYNDAGSSSNSGSDIYRGPEAFSEPETRMVRDFCREHDFKFVFNYHTFSNVLIHPYGYADVPADTNLTIYGKFFTRVNNYASGTVGNTLGYPVNGTSDDWMYGELQIRAFTPEVGPGIWGFWPAPADIEGLNNENIWSNRVMALCALHYGEVVDDSGPKLSLADSLVAFSLRSWGLEPGLFTVSMEPLSDNVLSVSAPQSFNLTNLEQVSGAFSLTFDPGIQPGEAVDLVLKLDNGYYVKTDTLHKTFDTGVPVVLLEEDWTDATEWVGEWSLTTESFTSAPTSMTDSPGSEYGADQISTLFLGDPIQLPAGASGARLRFMAKWALEKAFDYVQVQSVSTATGEYMALCGRYTNPGQQAQAFDEPLWDGIQDTWVEEEVDLSPVGNVPFFLQFVLVSDGFLQLDGFYLDDLMLEYFDPQVNAVVEKPLSGFRMTSRPNPASDHAFISWPLASGTAELAVSDALGRLVETRQVALSNGGYDLPVAGWKSGVYVCRLRAAEGETGFVKILIP